MDSLRNVPPIILLCVLVFTRKGCVVIRIDDYEDNYKVMVNYSDVYLALLEHRKNRDAEAVGILEKALSKGFPDTGFGAGPMLSIGEIKRVFPNYRYNPPLYTKP